MSVFFLPTKFYIPHLRENSVLRPRLTDILLAGVNRPGTFILVSGPAGFGKSTLLGEFVVQLHQPVAWVSLDEGDNDPVRFWSYLIAACQSVRPGIGESALELLKSPLPLPDDAVPFILINDFTGLESDLVLVLDDYHTIQNGLVHKALSFLLDHLPTRLHLILSTRVDPPWPLARFRARNQLIEIRAMDLRFTTEEADSFLNQVMGLNLSTEDVAALEERTEGWVAGLQLAALSMTGHNDVAGFIKAFTGSHVYIAEYLVEEVLTRQPEDVQAFLLQTSVLERMNAGLCEAVTTGENGQSVLMALHRANLFVIPLDDEGQWFRYHNLFADLLKVRLQLSLPKNSISALHQRAAAWYEQVGMTSEAIVHALAATDYSHVVRLVEKVALPMIFKAYYKTLEDWLQAIPPEYLSKNPRVNMAFAWMLLIRRDFAQAAPLMERLQRIFSTLTRDENGLSLQGEWLALQSMVLNAQGKAVESLDLAEQALKILPEEETQVRSMTYIGLINAYQQTLDYERAAEACEMIIQQGRKAGDLASEMIGLSYLGRMFLQQGKLHATGEIASEALIRVEQASSFSPFSATLYGELAQVYYHWHQLEKAHGYFLRSVELSTLGGFSDAEIYHSVFLSRLFQMEGDMETSVQEIEKAIKRMQTVALTHVNEEVISQQVSIYLPLNRLALAQTALEAYGFSFEGGFSPPEVESNTSIPHPIGLLYNSALRILLYQATTMHDPETLRRGIEFAEVVIEGSMRCRHLPIVLKTLLLRSQMQVALGNKQAGLANVSRALELSEPEGFISIFVEEGEAMKLLIADCRSAIAKTGQERLRNHIDLILEAFPSKGIPDDKKQPVINPQSTIINLIEPLSLRELEVLRLIADGDSNRAIAEKLVITVSAVKKHTGNIYGKLNINSRTQALARARQLGLLPQDG